MTTSITLRSTKGSALTHTEVDDNFLNLKITADGAAVAGAVTSSGLTMATGKLLGRTTASTGAVQEITAGAGLSLSSGQLEVDFTGYLTASTAASTYQPLDGDLTAIAGISGTSGLLKKTAANTWSLDTATYLTTTDAASTYQTQSGMSSYQPIDADLTAIAGLTGTSGFLTKTAANTWALDTSTYLTTTTASSSYQPLDADLTAVAELSTTGIVSRTGAGTFSTVTAPTGTVVGTSDTQTLTNKTIAAAVLNDGYTEEVFAITDGATVNLDPNNGSIQTWTLGASRTPGQENWAAGQSITLMIDDGTAYTITWTTLAPVWKTNGGAAPTLNTTGFTIITLWKVGTTIYGARVGDA